MLLVTQNVFNVFKISWKIQTPLTEITKKQKKGKKLQIYNVKDS